MFVKFDAWNAVQAPLIRAAFPDVPSVFVYRDPLEVMVSALRQRGIHTIPTAMDPALFGMKLPDAMQMPAEEYCARVLASIYRAGLQHRAPGKSILLNYNELPDATWISVAECFDLDLQADDIAQMRELAQLDPKTKIFFAADSERKQKEATEAVRAATERWIAPVYEELEKARSSF